MMKSRKGRPARSCSNRPFSGGFRMLLMGVDVGTTGVKAAVFDEKGTQHAYAFEGYKVRCDAPGLAEQDAEHVLACTLQAMKRAVDICGGDIEAISVSTQGDAVIPVGHDGAALAPAQLGMDYRATDEVAALEATFGAKELFHRTGMRPHPMNSVVKMMWFQRHQTELATRVWKYMTYSDFIMLRLGSADPVIDYSMASRTMCFSLERRRWASDIIIAAGLDVSLLSEIVKPGMAVGKLHGPLCAQLGFRIAPRLVEADMIRPVRPSAPVL